MLSLIENHVAFNECDGAAIARALRENRDLWRGVVMLNEGYEGFSSLICLRDIERDFWNTSSMFILAESGKESELLALAQTFKADEVDFLDRETTSRALGVSSAGYDPKVLRLWWD